MSERAGNRRSGNAGRTPIALALVSISSKPGFWDATLVQVRDFSLV